MSTNLNQQELRQLIRDKAIERQQNNKQSLKRIESPLARYDDKDRLYCVICNTIVYSESVWNAHLNEKTHKKKIDDLREQRNKNFPTGQKISKTIATKISQQNNAHIKKRSLSPEDTFQNKSSKFENLSEFSKKESMIKKLTEESFLKNDETIVDYSENISEEISGAIQGALPTDFFDSDITQSTVIATSSNMKFEKGKKSEEISSFVPKGFFDDFSQNKQAQKDHDNEMDAEMELFRKQIAEEVLLSEKITENDIENLQKEREIDEIEEQYSNWQKVDLLQTKIETMRAKKKDEKNKETKVVTESNVEEEKEHDDDNNGDENEDDDDENDFEDSDFWRSKTVFK